MDSDSSGNNDFKQFVEDGSIHFEKSPQIEQHIGDPDFEDSLRDDVLRRDLPRASCSDRKMNKDELASLRREMLGQNRLEKCG